MITNAPFFGLDTLANITTVFYLQMRPNSRNAKEETRRMITSVISYRLQNGQMFKGSCRSSGYMDKSFSVCFSCFDQHPLACFIVSDIGRALVKRASHGVAFVTSRSPKGSDCSKRFLPALTVGCESLSFIASILATFHVKYY
eukprot:g77788.t1